MMRKLLVGLARVASAESAVAQEPRIPVALPELHWRSDGILGAASLVGVVIGLWRAVTPREVPPEGWAGAASGEASVPRRQAGGRSRAAVHLPAGVRAADRRQLRRHHEGRVRVHA